MALSNSSSNFDILKKEWERRHHAAKQKLEEKHKEAFDFVLERIPSRDKIVSTSAAGIIMISSLAPSAPAIASITDYNNSPKASTEKPIDKTIVFVNSLKAAVPPEMRPLSIEEEASISAMLSDRFGMDIRPDIGGLKLNRSYGVIGAEQHLMRYPGDTMSSHFTTPEESHVIYSSGMAPGKGAWGYFARSQNEMTIQDIEREKWYIAVQTFEVRDYGQRVSEYRDFFKYRKMLVINSQTGQAVICDIADAGPAVWTGKHLGGSPEVMHYLGYAGGMRKGPVLYFFINDPNDTIPLGPIN